jgi:hypothetical protein
VYVLTLRRRKNPLTFTSLNSGQCAENVPHVSYYVLIFTLCRFLYTPHIRMDYNAAPIEGRSESYVRQAT